MAQFSWLLFASAAVTVLALYVLRPLAHRFDLLDHPGGRKDHEHATPVTGGMAMAIAIVIGSLLSHNLPNLIVSYAVCVGLLVAVGLWDDRHDLDWRLRVGVQCLAALIMIYAGGVRIDNLGVLFGLERIDLGFWSVPFTVFATVGCINAINMIDGSDGLAGLVSWVAMAMLAAAAAYTGNTVLTERIALVLGALGAFLWFNMRSPWRPRAHVIMGNAGSAFLGFTVAWVAFRLTQTTGHPVTPILAPFLIAPPVIDTLVLIARRLRAGRSPFSADHNHIHHLLRDAGFPPAAIAWLLAAVTGVIGTAGALAVKAHVPAPVLLAVFGLLVIGHFLATRNRAAAVQRLARVQRALQPGARNGRATVELATIEGQDATDPSLR